MNSRWRTAHIGGCAPLASAAHLGSGRIDDACAGFRESWSYGTEQLGAAAAEVRQQLGEGLRVYVETDQALASVVTT